MNEKASILTLIIILAFVAITAYLRGKDNLRAESERIERTNTSPVGKCAIYLDGFGAYTQKCGGEL